MKYRHITLDFSLRGLSPIKIINGLKKEGYEPLYANLIQDFSNFFGLKNPFETYKKIKLENRDEVSVGVNSESFVRYSFGIDKPINNIIFDFPQKSKLKSFGDLFKCEKNPSIVFCLYDRPASDSVKTTWLSCWTKENIDLIEPLDSFVTSFSKVIGCEKPVDELLDSDTFTSSNQKNIELLKEYNLNEEIFSEKKSVFEILSNEECKTLLQELSKKGNILLSEFLQSVPQNERDDKERLIKFLTGQKFLTRELIVICKQTGQWWNVTIPSKEKMKEIEELGIKCTSCGAKISDEKIDQFYKMSEKGKKLISGSYWMVGRVVNELVKLGARDNEIFVGVTQGSEEIDIMSFNMSHLLVFELKDREFGLGDAYKFHGKISRLNQKISCTIFPIIVTTKQVASEAKKLLEDVRGSKREYIFIEGLDSLENVLENTFTDITKEAIAFRLRGVNRCFPATLLNPWN